MSKYHKQEVEVMLRLQLEEARKEKAYARRALDGLGAHLAAAWTKERPTITGWYWWREQPDSTPCILRLTETGRLVQCGSEYDCKTLTGEWSGPLAPHK